RRQPTSTLFPYTTLFRSQTGERFPFPKALKRERAKTILRALDPLQIARYRTKAFGTGLSPGTPNAVISVPEVEPCMNQVADESRDRKSTRLNSSHVKISY